MIKQHVMLLVCLVLYAADISPVARPLAAVWKESGGDI